MSEKITRRLPKRSFTTNLQKPTIQINLPEDDLTFLEPHLNHSQTPSKSPKNPKNHSNSKKSKTKKKRQKKHKSGKRKKHLVSLSNLYNATLASQANLDTLIELQTYDYLSFKKKVDSFSRVCRLNVFSCSKESLLQKILTFQLKKFQILLHEEETGKKMPKLIFVQCTTLLHLLLQALEAINIHSWEVCYIEDSIIKKTRYILSDGFEEDLEVINLESLVSGSEFKTVLGIKEIKLTYAIFDQIPLLCNFIALICLKTNRNSLAVLYLMRAIRIRQMFKISNFDVFKLFMFSCNFLVVLKAMKESNRYLMLVKKLIFFSENYGHNFVTRGEVQAEHILVFRKYFRELDGAHLTEKILEEKIGFFSGMTILKMNGQLRDWIKAKLVVFYRNLADLCHDSGMFKQSYIAQDFYYKLKVEVVGDEYEMKGVKEDENLVGKVDGVVGGVEFGKGPFVKVDKKLWVKLKEYDHKMKFEFGRGDFSSCFRA